MNRMVTKLHVTIQFILGNVDVFEETKENYPRSYEYVKAYVNALDEV
jgi:hypothetical protein